MRCRADTRTRRATTCHAEVSPTPGPGHRAVEACQTCHPEHTDPRARRYGAALHAVSRPARLAEHQPRARDHHDAERREPADRIQQPPGPRRRQLRQCVGARHRRVRGLPHHDAPLSCGRQRAAALHVLVPRLSSAQRRIHAVRRAWLLRRWPWRWRSRAGCRTSSHGRRRRFPARHPIRRRSRDPRRAPPAIPTGARATTNRAHARALDDPARPPDQRGCEACHGAGQAHIDGGGGTAGNLQTFAASEPAPERATPCLRCHGNESALHGFTHAASTRAPTSPVPTATIRTAAADAS